jgi:hypothetical protein
MENLYRYEAAIVLYQDSCFMSLLVLYRESDS